MEGEYFALGRRSPILTARAKISGPICLNDEELDAIQYWQHYNNTGEHSCIADQEIYMPEESLLQCLDIYVFSEKYLITTMKQHY